MIFESPIYLKDTFVSRPEYCYPRDKKTSFYSITLGKTLCTFEDNGPRV